jgi:hypothetical protein
VGVLFEIPVGQHVRVPARRSVDAASSVIGMGVVAGGLVEDVKMNTHVAS